LPALFDNLPLKLFSLLLASLVWLFVMGEEHSERSYTVPVQISRLADGLVLLNEEDYVVEVQVSGPRGILNNLSDNTFTATLDLVPYGKGEVDVAIPREAIKAPKGVNITRIRPATVRVHLDSVVEKRIPLKAVVRGEPDGGYEVRGVQLDPPSISLTGPETLLTQITEIPTTPIDVTGLTGDATVPVRVEFQRHLVSWPARPLLAQVVVVPHIVTRALPVVAAVTGTVRDGYEVTEVKVTPEAVVVRGPQRLVEGLTQVSGGAVDVTDRHSPLSRQVTLSPPAEQVSFPETDRVAVQVEISERQEEREVTIQPLLHGEVDRDFQRGTVQVIPDRVRLRGPYRRLQGVKQVDTETVEIGGARLLTVAHPGLRLPAAVERMDGGSTVTVIVGLEERIAHRTLAVRPTFKNDPPADLQVERVEVRPAEVEVSGPAHLLRDLKEVVTKPLHLPAKQGRSPLAGVDLLLPTGVAKVTPARVEVSVTLAPWLVHRRLPVHPTLEGALPAGLRLTEVVVVPGQVEVVGPRRGVEAITELATAPISLVRARATQSLTVRVVAPAAGLEVTPAEVAVTLRVETE